MIVWVAPSGNDSRLNHGAERCLDSESILYDLQSRRSKFGNLTMRYLLVFVTTNAYAVMPELYEGSRAQSPWVIIIIVVGMYLFYKRK